MLRYLFVITVLAAWDSEGIAQTRPDLVDCDLRVDLPITIAAGAFWLGTQLGGETLAPVTCRWCDVTSFDAAGRRELLASDPAGARLASDILAFGVAPAAALGLGLLAAGIEHRYREFLVDALLVLEATFLSADVVQILKYSVARERPYVHAGVSPGPDNVSFPSGHTALAFSLAVSSGALATFRGYRLAPMVWSVGLAAATATGALRIAGDEHYLSDVIMGALIGSTIGLLVPLAHLPRARRALRGATPHALGLPSGGGIAVTGSW